jgi:hypothetical protein
MGQSVPSLSRGITTRSYDAWTVTTRLKLLGALAVIVAVALPLTATTQIPAGASSVASSKSLATPPKSVRTALGKDLLPSSYANKAGFSKVTAKVTTFKTGNTSCPYDAEEGFEDPSQRLSLISEAVDCTNSQGADTLLNSARSATSGISASPPKQLGSSAFERSSPGSVYEIYWLAGLTVEVVEIAAAAPAGSTQAPHPITSAQKKILSSAALEQNGLLG